jgi:uncharacterized protein YbcV (DUF1398 family)
MFTIEQIKTAHSKVKSGADFPAYVQDIKKLGVVSYDNYVSDGHTSFYAADGSEVSSGPKYPNLIIADTSSIESLRTALKVHQAGQTDYLTFCNQSAAAGVEKWTVDTAKLTCIYYDKEGKEMVKEEIPEIGTEAVDLQTVK